MELPASLHEHLHELEERLLRPDARRSRQALDELLSDDFVEFASDGVAYDKAQVIDALDREVRVDDHSPISRSCRSPRT